MAGTSASSGVAGVGEREYLEFLVSSGCPVLWCQPVVDGNGAWLPEIVDRETGEITGTGTAGSGYWLPTHKDPVVREKHRIRQPADVEHFLNKEPRPAFILLTGHVFDVVDIDNRPDELHDEVHRDARRRMQTIVDGRAVAEIDTPSGGWHYLVPTDPSLHSTSNVHSRIDYRGKGGIAWLPGTRKASGEYTVVSYSNALVEQSIPEIGELLAEFRVAHRECEHCRVQAEERAQRLYSGLRLGEGAGWDMVEEDLKAFDPTDPLEDTSAQNVANCTLTWRELLSPWFDVIGVRDTDVWLIRAGKVAEGRQGKSAVLHLADNRVVIYSSDWPVATGTQLSKLDVYAAIKEFEQPGEMPDEFAEQLKYLRDRWSAGLLAANGVSVSPALASKAGNSGEIPPSFPVLSTEFWEADPTLKRIYTDADLRRASPEGVLSSILVYILSNVGHQVRLPGRFSDDPREGASLNCAQIKVGGPGDGKGTSEAIARSYISPPVVRKFASGQAFPKAFGRRVPMPPPTEEELEDMDPFELQRRPTHRFERTNWSVYTEYEELDEFKAQGSSDTSTLSSVLRDVITSDNLIERVAVSEQSNSGSVTGFRFCMTAHAQPLRLEWLLEQSTNGFPQRFWWVWAAARVKSREELRRQPRVAPRIVPLSLEIPDEWALQTREDEEKPYVLVELPDCAHEDVATWELDADEDDVRGMLCVRLKSFVALKILLPEMDECDVWKLATAFHRYSLEVRRYTQALINADKAKNVAISRRMAAETAVTVQEAQEAKRLEGARARCRGRVFAVLGEGPKKPGALRARLSAGQQEVFYEVLDHMEAAGEVAKTEDGYRLVV